jgi:hypothetical protein
MKCIKLEMELKKAGISQINLKCMPERISASPGVSLALSG